MNIKESIIRWTMTALTAALMVSPAMAQQGDPGKNLEQAGKEAQDLVNRQKDKVRQTMAIKNLRQIGLALFEFETECGAYPDEKTAILVKENPGTKAELKAVTANDCFFQLIAAKFLQSDGFLSLQESGEPEKPDPQKPLERVAACLFAFVSGMKPAGHPGRPLVVAPLLKGKTSFDPQVLGGKAVVLFIDNSVRSFPIEDDGWVLIDGKDIFDPAQPFWDGKVPTIKWPEP